MKETRGSRLTLAYVTAKIEHMSKILLVIEDFTELKDLELVLRKLGYNVTGIASEFAMSQQILSFNPDIVIGSGQGTKVSSMGVGRRLREMPRWVGHTILGFPPGFTPPPQELLRIRMDNLCESPVTVEKILPFLARIEGGSESQLIEKLKVIKMLAATEEESDESSANNSIIGGGGFSPKNEDVFIPGVKREDENPFVTPDFKAIEAELTSLVHKSPTLESENPSDLVKNTATFWRDSIDKANNDFKGRLSKAMASLKSLKLLKDSSLNRKLTRKVQNDLSKDWDPKALEDQDKSRREFTRFLFKKK
jgi:hypothetical protein